MIIVCQKIVYKKFKSKIEAETFMKDNNSAGAIHSIAVSSASKCVADVVCKCGYRLDKKMVRKDSANKGREFYSCDSCKYFEWVEGSKGASMDKKSNSAYFSVQEKSIVIYTDGGCKNNSNVSTSLKPAGWGAAVVLLDKDCAEEEGILIVELWGPVVIDKSSPYFIQALYGTCSPTLIVVKILAG